MPFDEHLTWALRCLQLCFVVALLTAAVVFTMKFSIGKQSLANSSTIGKTVLTTTWTPPDSTSIPMSEEGDLIRYGKELIAHTAVYLGPNGKVMKATNGMNCQNCHLNAGRKIFGNNYSAVSATYPKFRPRSGTIETVEKRINDCVERSLNGQPLIENSREMKAMKAYILWVGSGMEKNKIPKGAGLIEVTMLDRAADPEKGEQVFTRLCASCHGPRGEGVRAENQTEWKYPPLHGENSYNTGAGLYRLSRFAGYIKANMPNGATWETPILSDEEAWDVAAFINSLPRPSKIFPNDWPDISKKPVDHPFGPYADNFSEKQHKYGPFKEMVSK